jgi:hypothetical protein
MLRTPPRIDVPGARLLAILAAIALAAGSCSSSAAAPSAADPTTTPTAEVTATITLTPAPATATSTPAPTPEPSIPDPTATATATLPPPPPPKPPVTAPPIATPAPLPNITGTAPVVTPASPSCGHKFTVDVEVGNKGLGPMPGSALAIIGIVRVEAGGDRIMFKYPFTIPALAPGTSTHLRETKILNTSGHFRVTAFLDSSLWITESRETDNEVSSDFNIYFTAGCSKI